MAACERKASECAAIYFGERKTFHFVSQCVECMYEFARQTSGSILDGSSRI
jgi:hypothetical protein